MSNAAPETTRPSLATPAGWALYGAHEHLDDWRRVHSIIFMLQDRLEAEIQSVEAKGELLETGEADEFAKSVEWLLGVMEQRRNKIRDDLKAAGVS